MAVLLAQGANVTWIQVPRPTFDLAGVLISSLSLTGIMAAIALTLGTAVGITLIRRRDRESVGAFAERVSLHLMADHPQS
jgi:hypothetical protein